MVSGSSLLDPPLLGVRGLRNSARARGDDSFFGAKLDGHKSRKAFRGGALGRDSWVCPSCRCGPRASVGALLAIPLAMRIAYAQSSCFVVLQHPIMNALLAWTPTSGPRSLIAGFLIANFLGHAPHKRPRLLAAHRPPSWLEWGNRWGRLSGNFYTLPMQGLVAFLASAADEAIPEAILDTARTVASCVRAPVARLSELLSPKIVIEAASGCQVAPAKPRKKSSLPCMWFGSVPLPRPTCCTCSGGRRGPIRRCHGP